MNRFLSRSRALVAVGLSCAALAMPAHAAVKAVEVDRIVAVVNNEVITALQLRERVAQATRQLQRQGGQLPPVEVLERQLLERLIVERAQLQLARDTSLRVDDGMLERAIARIAANNKLSSTELRAALERDGVSWSRFRDEIRTEIVLTRLREREVDNKVVVTDAEVENFLTNNPDAFSGIEFQLAHILLRAPEGASPEQIARLRERAEKVMARLRSGEDFARVAAETSDASDGISGGNIGWRERDRLPALYADAARDLKPGELSPVLRSASGLHIVKLVDKRGGAAAGPQQLEQTRARHILIKTSEVLSDTEAEARLLALRERVVNGADFGELAKANSADLSAAKGGDLGWVNPGDTVPEFERAMNALKPGDISAPVRSPFGWHLIQVTERRVQDVTEERKLNAARAILRERKAEAAYEDWLRQLRDSTYVDYRLERE
ncbi:molecular chaperone SurA [Parazoarcus communis]|uniref:Chaperone SurA n=1 Tax=Parazoarcus communis TaxID=41977 RepID=A0A2U8GXX2_9RHOO|nr:peptidylprolyl isomerase [Parazoarcus communis]AWI77305.1 molecular chaperone SurA [Parazoarcus communis]